MKLNPTLLSLLAVSTAVAQTAPTAKPAVHHSAPGACAKLPDLSSKIPALPAGTPCAKHLYTIAVKPSAELGYVSPLANSADLRETLHIQEASSFSLDYIDIKPGSGAAAASHKWLTVKYSGYLVDGTKFDSSDDHPEPPFSFQYAQLGGPASAVAGWETGFDGMHVGAKRRLFIPYQLGYGAGPHGAKIPAKSMLIFDLELVAVSDKDPNPPKTPPAGAQRPGAGPGGVRPQPLSPPVGAAPSPSPATPPTTPPAAATPKP